VLLEGPRTFLLGSGLRVGFEIEPYEELGGASEIRSLEPSSQAMMEHESGPVVRVDEHTHAGHTRLAEPL
jgi:hypothetical protein